MLNDKTIIWKKRVDLGVTCAIIVQLVTLTVVSYAEFTKKTADNLFLVAANRAELATHAVEIVAYVTLWNLLSSNGGSRKSIVRVQYLDWAITTPVMLYALRAMVSFWCNDRTSATLVTDDFMMALAANCAMLAIGYAATVSGSRTFTYVAFGIGMLLLVFVFWHIWQPARNHAAAQALVASTFGVWSL